MMRPMTLKSLFVACTVGLSVVALSGRGVCQNAAPTTPRLSLPRAVELLRQQNLKLVASRHEVSAARADAIAAGLISNPNLSFGAQFLTHGVVTGGEEELTVMLSQALPLSGHVGLRRDAANAAATAAEWEFAAETWRLVGDLKRAYLGLELAEARHGVLERGLLDLERVQHVLDERSRAGANPAYDRIRLDVERGSLRARLSQAEVDVVDAKSILAHAIGGETSATGLAVGSEMPEPAAPPTDDGALVRAALVRRPELTAGRNRVTAAELATRAAARRYVPSPELGIGYTRFVDVPEPTGKVSGGAALVSVSLPLPIFDHGQGTIERHEAQKRAAATRLRDAQFGIRREVERASGKLRTSFTAYVGHRDHVAKDIQSVRQIAEVAYREGRATILELLDAYSSHLRVEEQAIALQGLALEAGVELEQAVGP
jgi:cobalt-zinc-cadmium efflux system outer membrane protein